MQSRYHYCHSCKAKLEYRIVHDMQPHLYCTHCHNVYHEQVNPTANTAPFWHRIANRQLHQIQSHAPVCSCGGMFLANARPHCTHCGQPIPYPIPDKPKQRLAFGDMVVFPDTLVYLDNGTTQRL